MTGLPPADPAQRERFGELFALVFEPLQAYVLRRGGGSDTDDIVAEALTVLWRRLDDVPTDAPIAWAFGVARRCLANHRRSTSRRDQLVERIASNPVPEPSQDEALDEALARLDADQREILRLWAWEGLAPREIAVVMNITANAVSIRLHRARRDLAQMLEAGKSTVMTGHSGDRTTEEHR
jgi:RNA polymerase sigma-70 factor (ECF subfamily)